jgi:periplasmic protein TonB
MDHDGVRTFTGLFFSLLIHMLVAVVLRNPDLPRDQKLDEPMEMIFLDLSESFEDPEELPMEPMAESAEEPVVEPEVAMAVEPELALEEAPESIPDPELVHEEERQSSPSETIKTPLSSWSHSVQQERLILLGYTRMVRSRIEAEKHYPLGARRREQTGEVVVRFSIDRYGQIMEGPEVYKPSRYTALNNAALEAVKKAVPFPGFPEELEQERMAFEVPILFSLDI